MNVVLRQLQSEINSTLHGLNATQTQLCPTSHKHKWSIQQNIEHLLLTYSSTETVIDGRLAKRTPTRATPTVANRIFQVVTRCGYFPQAAKPSAGHTAANRPSTLRRRANPGDR
jgi:hypothetical protein